MEFSSQLSQLPLSDSSNPPSDFELPDSPPRLVFHERPLKLQRSCRSPREVRTLPFELQEQSRILFEETLYGQALRLLQCLLTAGYTNGQVQQWRPAFVAPPAQLALVATLAIHPSLTTGTNNRHKLAASVEAMRYLRLVHTMVGPLESNLNKAYRFPDRGSATRRGIFIRQRSRSPVAPTSEITSSMVTSEAVWTQGKDFWSTIGWIFNCSVKHRARWDIWHPWLDHMLSVLYEDWLLNCLDAEQSLIVSFIRDHDARKVFRSVFAGGGKNSLQEFGEVWKNETAPPKAKKQDHDKVRINFELDEFGDYLKDSSEEDEVDKVDRIFEKGTPGLNLDSPDDRVTSMGGAESIELRMRLLAILSEVALQCPQVYVDSETFVQAFVTSTRPLSLGDLKTVLSVFTLDYFARPLSSVLVQSIACSLMESTAPREPLESLTQDDLTERYLPWTANTSSAIDNAKLSACIETLLRLYTTTNKGEEWNDRMLQALRSGIQRRESKAHRGAKSRTGSPVRGELTDFQWLTSSGLRLLRLAQSVRSWPG